MKRRKDPQVCFCKQSEVDDATPQLQRRDAYIEGLKANIRRSEANIAECEKALQSAKPDEADMFREMIALHKRFIGIRQSILDDLRPLQRRAVAA